MLHHPPATSGHKRLCVLPVLAVIILNTYAVHFQDCDDLFARDLFGNTFPIHTLACDKIIRGRGRFGCFVLDVGNGPRDGLAIPRPW